MVGHGKTARVVQRGQAMVEYLVVAVMLVAVLALADGSSAQWLADAWRGSLQRFVALLARPV